ncbi:pyridoxamine phosphate oxidase family protein [Glonium stellatum]|uniref:Pyridoxamine phosphate oxidase family protein n=1 Tax=Glonium stellatum TaxID=574774 RepID=A0A8E2F8F5_9PEZI|nr:pyridoxamine phosphate oxidase family protein [Glonium stellatum]
MVKFFPSIEPDHVDFMLSQPLFFVASAPYVGRHVNLSPKGQPSRSFAILDSNTVAYIDATGSGCETIAHIYENRRVTIMFCSFGVSPRIMRLFCQGQVVEKDDKGFEELMAKMGNGMSLIGARAVILLRVFKVQTSCGFGVPLLAESQDTTEEEKTSGFPQKFQDRWTLHKWASSMEEKKALLGYQRNSNYKSLDGLTGLRSARRARGQWMLLEAGRARIGRIMKQWEAIVLGMLIMAFVMVVLKTVGFLVLEAKL